MPFASVGGRICPACNEQIDKDFITVRDYIDENNHSNIEGISKETGVSQPVIIYLLKEGRLVIDGPIEGGGVLACELCRVPINTGRMCKSCMSNVASTIDKNASGKKKAEFKEVEMSFKASAKINK